MISNTCEKFQANKCSSYFNFFIYLLVNFNLGIQVQLSHILNYITVLPYLKSMIIVEWLEGKYFSVKCWLCITYMFIKSQVVQNTLHIFYFDFPNLMLFSFDLIWALVRRRRDGHIFCASSMSALWMVFFKPAK